MSKQEKLEKQRIGGMLICLALLTAGSMLFLPRLVRMGLQRVGLVREEMVMISPSPSPQVVASVENGDEAVSCAPSPSPGIPYEAQGQPIASSGRAGLGILCIGKKEIPVAIGVDEATLADGPGWMPDSALPGQVGMSVILGHRNRKHLRPLQDVEIGDSLCFRYPDGREYTYTVSEIVKYEDTADWRLPALGGNTLVLVTCYPFHYSGNAPGKYVVTAIITY
jgi:LPXTG-site transpeptidase (sortase) family protein